MQLFGGDPRIVFMKIMMDINKWYAMLIIILFLFLALKRSSDKTFVLIYIMFAVVEIMRLLLGGSLVSGNASIFTAFLVITAMPLIVIDFLWLFFVESINGLDYVAITGMIIFHVVELVGFGIYQLIQLSKYQTSYFTFHYGYRSVAKKEHSELEMDDLD